MQRPVADLILQRAPRTLLLAAAAFVLGIPIGMAVGVLSATSQNRHVDRFWTTATLIGYAIPGFWLGQLLVILFAMQLGWFPTQGMAPLISRATGVGWLLERVRYLALPAITYAIYEATRVARLMRASDDRDAGGRLHRHRPGQGPVARRDHPRPRAAQFEPAGRHRHGLCVRRRHGRRGADRDRVLLAGHRAAA